MGRIAASFSDAIQTSSFSQNLNYTNITLAKTVIYDRAQIFRIW